MSTVSKALWSHLLASCENMGDCCWGAMTPFQIKGTVCGWWLCDEIIHKAGQLWGCGVKPQDKFPLAAGVAE